MNTKVTELQRHLAAAVADGFAPVEMPPDAVPEGYAVLAKGEFFVGLCYDGTRSSFLGQSQRAARWCSHQAAERSGVLADVGDLWDLAGRAVVVFGNAVSESGHLWVMDWETGERADPHVAELTPREDRRSLSDDALIDRVTLWARDGNPDALWWLGWWFEGVNHPRSIWYYVAALRVAPAAYGWALERLRADAVEPTMHQGVRPPDLRFVASIPELNGSPIGGDWRAAVAAAEGAVHVPSLSTAVSMAPPVTKALPRRHGHPV